jgi:ABC-2 type transport system permease protein
MTPWLWIVRKDLSMFFSDRRGALMVIALPVLLGMLMSTLFSPSHGLKPVPVAVVNDDGGTAVAALVERLETEPAIKVESMSTEEARAAITRGEIGVGLRFAPGAAAALAGGATSGAVPLITAWLDPSRTTEGDIALEKLEDAMMVGVEVPRPALEVAVKSVVAAGPRAGFSPHAHGFSGMLMQFLLFWAASCARGLHLERQAGMLDRVRLSRAGPGAILFGTAASVAAVSLLATFVVFTVAWAAFDVEIQSGLAAFALVAVAQAAFAGAFALFLAGIGRSERQIDAAATLAILVLCFLSGAWVPSFMLPELVDQLGPYVPTRWILDGFAGATWRGLGLGYALHSALVVLGIAVVVGGIGGWLFTWRNFRGSRGSMS